jgi:hypothetical protein
MSKVNRANRQAARQTKKQTRVENRGAKQMQRVVGRQEKQTTRITGRQGIKRMAAENALNSESQTPANDMQQEVNLPSYTDTLNDYKNKEYTPEDITPKMQTKATNYLIQRGRQSLETNPELLAAQVMEERERQIEARRDQAIEEMNQLSYPDYPKEEEYPDEESIHNSIMEEEENTFGFTGEEDNFVDPATLGVLLNVGEASANKYRENRFAKGQKAFGKTQKQWEAEQKKKEKIAKGELPDPSIINAASKEAEEQIIKVRTDEFKADNFTMVIVVGIVIVASILLLQKKD